MLKIKKKYLGAQILTEIKKILNFLVYLPLLDCLSQARRATDVTDWVFEDFEAPALGCVVFSKKTNVALSLGRVLSIIFDVGCLFL